MHPLFGDNDAVNGMPGVHTPEGWTLEGAEHGDRIDEWLRYVHLAPEKLAQIDRRKLAASASAIPATQRAALLAELEAGLSGYTYLSE